MLIKICGITNSEAALTAVKHGANWLGFVFAPSKRKISAAQAADIAAQLPSSVKKVGVFVNETKETIEQIAREVSLDYIQLHGDEPARFAASLDYPVIKAFSIDQIEKMPDAVNYPCAYMLVDSPPATYRGGSGSTFNWERLRALKLDHEKLILAGGLNAANVAEAIRIVQPAGVDVSSGVETDGVKDVTKIAQFIQAVRSSMN